MGWLSVQLGWLSPPRRGGVGRCLISVVNHPPGVGGFSDRRAARRLSN